jgi:hypothetical protein
LLDNEENMTPVIINFDELEGGVNLDGQDREWLATFWQLVDAHPIRTARALFPTRPAGYVDATQLLGSYAINKGVAMRLREEGSIREAEVYEKACELNFAELPDFAKW